MIPRAELQWVAPEADVLETLTLMDEKNVAQVPVVENGRFLGLIGRDHVLRVIRARLEFPT
jgi:predicted transcriptional regulator